MDLADFKRMSTTKYHTQKLYVGTKSYGHDLKDGHFSVQKELVAPDIKTKNGVQITGTNTCTNYGYETQKSGSSNIAFGYQAGSANTGDNIVAIGYQSLKVNTGNDNVAVGHTSLLANTSGTQNIAIGSEAGASITDTDSNILIGYQSGTLTTGSDNTGIGNATLNTLLGGNNNIAIGSGAGGEVQTGSGNICIGYNTNTSSPTATNQIVIGTDTEGTGNNEITLGNTSITAIKANTVTTITAYSDKRIKKNIITNDLGLDFIAKLRPVKYNKVNPADYPEELLEKRFKGDNPSERPEDDENVYDGLIAQEVEAALESLGKSWSGHSVNESDGKQGIQYGALVIPLINAVQELTKRIEVLENSS